MIKKNDMLNAINTENFTKIDRDRGTHSATGDSLDLSYEGISKPEQRLSASDGESARRGVPADEMKQPIFVNEDAEYCKYLAKFFKGEK